MESKPRADLSAFGAFESAVLLAKELVAQGALRWAVSAAGFVKAKVDNEALKKIRTQEEIGEFRRILNREITRIIDTISHGWNEDIWYRSLLSDDKDAEVTLTDKELSEVAGRISLVRTHLVIDSIKERVLLRRTTKRDYLEEIHWETSIKKQDQQNGDIDVPFMTLELVLSKTSRQAYLLPSGHLHESSGCRRIAIDCHVDDIDAIIQELKLAQQNLKRLYPSSME